MTPAARLSAAIEVLDTYLDGVPLERALTNWARQSRFAGSKDRAAIRDIVFDCVRSRASFATRAGTFGGRGLVSAWSLESNGLADTRELFSGEKHAPNPLTRQELSNLETKEVSTDTVSSFDLPEWLVAKFEESLGDDALKTARSLRSRAPVFLRVNGRKANRNRSLELLAKQGVQTKAHPNVDSALEVVENPRRVSTTSSYEEGFVELQDASSQAACLALPSASKVLDYCAGGGGKILAYGALHDAVLFAHDANPGRLKDLPLRASRAGIEVTCLSRAEAQSNAPYDLVIADAPCSGSGTWRRAPDGKWAITPEMLAELTLVQTTILDEAAQLVGLGGTLAFMTCSVLREENETQVELFLSRWPDFKLGKLKRFAVDDRGDGFFFAHLTRP